MKYPVGVKDPIIREWMAQWAREWEVYAPRPVEVYGADHPGIGDTQIISSTTYANVGDPVSIAIPDGAEAVIHLQGRLQLQTGGGAFVRVQYGIVRGGEALTDDEVAQAGDSATLVNARLPIARTVVDRITAGVYEYRLQARLVGASSAEARFIGMQWLVEIRPAKPRTYDRG